MKSKIQKLLFFFIFSILSSSVFSQKFNLDYSVLTIPVELLENANEVMRVDETKIFVKDEKSATMKIKTAVTLLNEKSQADRFVLHYDSNTEIKNISANIYDKTGKLVRKMEKNEVQDQSAINNFSIYEDNRVKFFDLNHSEYPYTIQVKYEQEIAGISFAVFPNWRIQKALSQSVQSSKYHLSFPESVSFLYKAYNTDIQPNITEEKNMNFFSWEAKNIPAIKSELFGLNIGELIPYVLISPEVFQIEKYQGSMKTWKDYGDFMNVLWKDKNELSVAMQEKVKELTSKAASDQDKIDILYQYMQKNMRYVSVQLGIGGWQPFDAQYVEKNKYGDCKALTNFMMSMLDVIGIDSDPALIYAGDSSLPIDQEFTSPQFNHVILNVPSEDYWLECTSNYSPPNYLGSSIANKPVMLIDEEGGKISKTPTLSPEDNLSERKISVKLSNEGAAIVHVKANLHGNNQEMWRYCFNEESEEDLKKRFHRNSKMPTFKIDEFSVFPSKDKPITTLDYQVQIYHYASKAGKRLFIPFNVVNPHTYVPPNEKERTQKINIKGGYSDNDEIILVLPSGYKVESLPEGKQEIKSEIGTYSLEFEVNENKVICRRALTIKPAILPAEKYAEIRNFYKSVTKADKTKLVLVENGEVIKP